MSPEIDVVFCHKLLCDPAVNVPPTTGDPLRVDIAIETGEYLTTRASLLLVTYSDDPDALVALT